MYVWVHMHNYAYDIIIYKSENHHAVKYIRKEAKPFLATLSIHIFVHNLKLPQLTCNYIGIK